MGNAILAWELKWETAKMTSLSVTSLNLKPSDVVDDIILWEEARSSKEEKEMLEKYTFSSSGENPWRVSLTLGIKPRFLISNQKFLWVSRALEILLCI